MFSNRHSTSDRITLKAISTVNFILFELGIAKSLQSKLDELFFSTMMKAVK